MKKTIIAVAVLSMFSTIAYAKADPCDNPNPPAVCNPTPPVTPQPGPITVNPIIAPVSVVAPIIAPTTIVSPTIAPVVAPVIAPEINSSTYSVNHNVNDLTNTSNNNNTNNNTNTATGGNASASAAASASGGQGGIGIGGSSNNSGNNTGTANVVVQGDAAQERNPVSTAVAPTVVTGNDQCLVPVGLGGQAVGFGVSFGYAVRDEICEVLKLSRTVEYLTDKATALHFLRMHDKRVDDALKSIGK